MLWCGGSEPFADRVGSGVQQCTGIVEIVADHVTAGLDLADDEPAQLREIGNVGVAPHTREPLAELGEGEDGTRRVLALAPRARPGGCAPRSKARYP